MVLIPAFDQNEKLFDGRLGRLAQRSFDAGLIANGSVPQGVDGRRTAWCELTQPVVGFGVGLRQGGQRVDTQ